MIHLPDCSVTDTHARGLRRAEDRRVDERRTNWKIQRNPRRFGPRVRQTHADLLGQYGAGRVILTESSKKSAEWFVASRVTADLYRLLCYSIERTRHASPRKRSALPLVATGHCYERFIQGLLRGGVAWVGVMLETFENLLSIPDYKDQKPSAYKVWIAAGLVVVEVPESGDAIMKTVIAADALIGPNRDLWEALGKSEIRAQRFTRRPVIDWFEEPAERPLEEVA
jgi:hypothetical protein